MRILAARAGPARFHTSSQGEWRSAIEKHRLTGPVRVTEEGLEGDQQADRRFHGGPDKAVLAYCVDHYADWQAEYGSHEFLPGAVGENLEITGQSEGDVCIGDSYLAGGVLFQVTQPRQPCWKPAWWNNLPDLTKRIADTGRTGWYLRVLQTGVLETPCALDLQARPHPDWSVQRANRILYQKTEDGAAKRELAELPELSAAWRDMLRSQA